MSDDVLERDPHLHKVCVLCGHAMDLISEEPQAMNQPIRRWQCTCGHWEPVYTRQDEQ